MLTKMTQKTQRKARVLASFCLLMMFGILTVGAVWFIVVQGYEMGFHEWGLFALYIIGTVASAGALWQEWQRRSAAP